jgi:hypothetical protein
MTRDVRFMGDIVREQAGSTLEGPGTPIYLWEMVQVPAGAQR